MARRPVGAVAGVRPPRPGRAWWVTGLVVAGVALLAGTACAVMIVAATFGPLRESMSAPARQCPLDAVERMHPGRYAVFELTGTTEATGPVTLTKNHAPRLAPQDVQVSAPDGRPVTAVPLELWHSESLTRGTQVFTAVAYLQIPSGGAYRIRVDGAPGATVVIAPSMGWGGELGWLAGGVVSGLVLVIGLVLVLVGLLRGRRPVPGPAGAAVPGAVLAGPPPGWYPDPGAPDRMRYWDGRSWLPR